MFLKVNVLTKALVRSFAAALVLATIGAQAQTVSPVLVPYNMTALAGNSQSATPGYGGEGVPGLNATMSSPIALAVDSVGDVYIADQSNALIREYNPRTNTLKTIAGVPPSGCTGTVCTTVNSGCVDGAPASTSQVGSKMLGLVVDGYGNVYYSDYNYQGVWVIYRGGAQVANFINLVDSTGVTNAGGVLPGYIYHVAGVSTPKAGGGCSATSGVTDNLLATQVKFHDPLHLGIDAAGNLYVQDYANNIVRVINTQSTAQTFLGITVQPGFVSTVVGCNATLNLACPSSTPPWGTQATKVSYTVLTGMTADQFGNVYQVNGKGAAPAIFGGVAYSGGSTLAHLLNLESGLTPVNGGWYEVVNSITSTYCTGYSNPPTCSTGVALEPAVPANGANNIALRPDAITVDPLGNVYMIDTHWQDIYRVDANSMMASRLMPGLLNSSQVAPAGTLAAPVYCTSGATSGPQAFDAYGDGCPVQQAKMSTTGTGYITFDAAGNLYFADAVNNLVRKIGLGNQFSTLSVGASATQTMQLHFDAGNLPTSNSAAAFNILNATSEFAVSNVNCANYTIRDASIECYVSVTFSPKYTGRRNATLQASTAAGTYNFSLTGVGSGPQMAIDGGAATAVPITGLGKATAIAFDVQGNLYSADTSNNRVVKTAASGGATTAIGSGLKTPMGVAVDASGNVYIADTGNNRVVEVAATTGTQTVLTTNVKAPQGLAIDAMGNVYIADTGNARIMQISPFGELGAVPMLTASGSQTFVSPVAVAVDSNGYVYVADSGNANGIIKIAPGGGDFQVSGTTSSTLLSFGTANITSPTGIAVDGANDVYVTDSTSNTVQVLYGGSGSGATPFTLGFTGLSSPAGLALDNAGNLYLADSGNSRVLFDNRVQATASFGVVPQFQPAATIPMVISNIGTSPITPTSPFATVSGATADFTEKDACAASNFPLGTLATGTHCSFTPSFKPVVNGPLSASVSVNGGLGTLALSGTGENPIPTLTMSVTSPTTGPVYGSPATVTLVATQPNGAVPTGSITFNYTINGTAQTPVTIPLTVSGSQATAALTLNNLLAARTYVITATYNGDTNNSTTTSTSFSFTVPGLPVTVTANSVSFTYGGTVPTLTGTVTGILPADQAAITISFTTTATSSTNVGTYPITAVLTGGNAANYTVPAAVTSTGAAAVVTENAAPLTIVVQNFNTIYGDPDQSFDTGMVKTGLVNGDLLTNVTFNIAHSSVLDPGTYTIIPTLSIPVKGSTYDKINNYKVTVTNGTLVVTQRTPPITITQAAKSVLPTNLAGALITVALQQPNNTTQYGAPTGTVTMTDTFTPITNGAPGTTVTKTPVTLTLTTANKVSSATYTPTDPTLGTHVYVFTYSGDTDFTTANTSLTPTTLVIDTPDFTVNSTSSPLTIVPGVVPGGDPTQTNEQAAYPEQALVYVAPILAPNTTVTLSCAAPVKYVTCTLSSTSLTFTGGTATQTSTVSISVPATLPIGYTGSLRTSPSGVVLAFIPAGLLVLLPLMRRRRKVTQLLLAAAAFAVLATAGGCGGNLVQFYTPVPAGPSSVTVTGTNGTQTRTYTIPINIQ